MQLRLDAVRLFWIQWLQQLIIIFLVLLLSILCKYLQRRAFICNKYTFLFIDCWYFFICYSESVNCGYDGIYFERHIQLHLHAELALAVRHAVLQDSPVHCDPVHLRLRIHTNGYFDWPVSTSHSYFWTIKELRSI